MKTLKVMNHSARPLLVAGLASCSPGVTEMSQALYKVISNDPAFLDGRLELLNKDALEPELDTRALESTAQRLFSFED